jgi:hypothetical protein
VKTSLREPRASRYRLVVKMVSEPPKAFGWVIVEDADGCELHQQTQQPYQVAIRNLNPEHPLEPLLAAQLGMRHATDLHHPLTNDLAEPAASVPRSAPVDVRPAIRIDVLRHIQGDTRGAAVQTRPARPELTCAVGRHGSGRTCSR